MEDSSCSMESALNRDKVVRAKRLKKTLKLITAGNQEVYNLAVEMAHITERNIDNLFLELDKISSRDNFQLNRLVETIIKHLKVHFFSF